MRSQFAKFDAKSVVAGVFLAMTCVMLLGAEKAKSTDAKHLSNRFLVLESKPVGDAANANGFQSHLLTLSPYYGKINHNSLKFRLANETPELKLVVTVSEGYEIYRGDIIGFELSQHLRLTPGSKVERHLPSGVSELVP